MCFHRESPLFNLGRDRRSIRSFGQPHQEMDEVGATLGVFSARVGLNPLEMIDLILGFGGLDIANDD